MEHLSDVINGCKRNCHHVYDVTGFVDDRETDMYHLEVKCKLCGYTRRCIDITKNTLDWYYRNPYIFKLGVYHEDI